MKVLLIDTSSSEGGVALADKNAIVVSEALAPRSSSQWLQATERLLASTGWAVGDIEAVGVVGGPGSFTGVRVGLAAAKGFCCTTGAALAVVSRLEVLSAARSGAMAVLDAGRGHFYVRNGTEERLCDREQMLEWVAQRHVVVGERELVEKLVELQPELHTVKMENILTSVHCVLAAGGSDIATSDANYVWSEREIYRQPSASASTSSEMAQR